jgi:ferredoxin-NADP reductase
MSGSPLPSPVSYPDRGHLEIAMHDLILLSRETVADGTTAFHFSKPEGFTFEPGQYLDFSLVAPREVDPAGNLRSFSIASAPHEAHLTVATRTRPTPFKRELAALAPGARVRANGPLGDLRLEEEPERIVFVAGGIGITPFRAMLRHLAHQQCARDVTLIYGNRTPESSAFVDELDALRRQLAGFRVVQCMSEPHKCPSWTGESGFVNEDLLARHIDDLGNALFYVVGPPAMTAALQDALMNLDVPDEHVRVEEFAGY